MGMFNLPSPIEDPEGSYRSTFLPAMRDKNGRISAALPGLLTEPYNAVIYGLMGGSPEQQAYSGMTTALSMLGGGVVPTPKGPGTLGANVWHGSPHKFDKFDSSKIGTGEGAQAYGHGLYFAETPDVARGYQEALSSRWDKTFLRGEPLADQHSDVANAIRTYNQSGGGNFAAWKKETAERMRGAAVNGPGRGRPDRAKELMDAADTISGLRAADIKNTGNLYKVDLPDTAIAKMLDWDKPLSQQAPGVKDAVLNAAKNSNDPWLTGWAKTWEEYPNATGQEMYRSFANRMGNQNVPAMQSSVNVPMASDALRQQGIPGIRYLDQGSRGSGVGTSNYVVFPGEEGMLKIMERNGVLFP